MEEWRDAVLERIRRLHPRKILEIGCGTGLLLFQLAAGCERYVGTDLSRGGLAKVQKEVDRRREISDRVHLIEGAAHELTELELGTFDTVIINSVTQYFPSLSYLNHVM